MDSIDVLNFGSLNIDHVYQVPHFVRPGETLSCREYARFAGGKGLNQSVALARAGVRVAHAGKIGADGEFLEETLRTAGVDTHFLLRGPEATGHAIIQVDREGQNCILFYPGANQTLTREEILGILGQVKPGTILLLQNEINEIPFLLEEGKRRGLICAINPAPCGPEVLNYPLELADLLFVNEVEGAELSGGATAPAKILDILTVRYPDMEIILTLGGDGACRGKGPDRFHVASPAVPVVDTTSAGDTFTGYYLAARLRGCSPERAMETAALAGSLAVSRAGAAASIPRADEVFSPEHGQNTTDTPR